MTEQETGYDQGSAYAKVIVYVYEIREKSIGGLGPDKVKYVAFTPGHDMTVCGGTSKAACYHLMRDLIDLGEQPKGQGYEMRKTTLKDYEKLWRAGKQSV